jgi:vacuolar-type H+-ATPase subunit D/Vma8
MTSKLKDIKRQVLVDELQTLLDELKSFRSGNVSESEESSRSARLAQRVELARGKLDDLKRDQRREKEIQAHRRRIEQDNARRN